MAPAEPRFRALQRAFSAHLRDPEGTPRPDLPERGLEVYRHAVYANIERFMHDNFPRVAEVLGEPAWRAMVRDYLVRHVSRTPLFVELPDEFLAYLGYERDAPDDPPFLYELAHFDWLENVLASDGREIHEGSCVNPDQLLHQPLAINPVHRVERYTWPVHAVNATFMPDAVPMRPSLLVAFRDRQDEFRVLDLNPVALALFEGVRGGRPANEILDEIATALAHPDPAEVFDGGAQLLKRWLELGLVLGTPGASGH